MLLASETTTPSLHDALLDVNWSHLGCGSLGSTFRTGTAQVAAPQLHFGLSRNPSDYGAADIRVGRDELPLSGGCNKTSDFLSRRDFTIVAR